MDRIDRLDSVTNFAETILRLVIKYINFLDEYGSPVHAWKLTFL